MENVLVNEKDEKEEILSLIEEGKRGEAAKKLSEWNAVDAAELFGELDRMDTAGVFRLLPKDSAAEVFAEMDPEVRDSILLVYTDREAVRLLDELYLDDTIDVLGELPAGMVSRMLRLVSPETRAEVNRFLNYPENSVGSIMTPEVCSVHLNFTVREAAEHIRRFSADKEMIYTVYVTDSFRTLRGMIDLRDLIFSDPEENVENIMEDIPAIVHTEDDRETASTFIAKYDLFSLPVVDREERLVGIVTVDDAIDVMEEETTEDIEKMAAILPSERPYLKTGVFETWRQRIPWLLVLLVSATFTGLIISHFEDALSRIVVLTSFIPMIMDSGGNAGGQSSVTVIRGLSLGEIRLRDIGRVLWKEFRVALLCGATMATVAFLKSLFIDGLFFTGEWQIGLIVAGTLFLAVLVAKIVGCSLPILAKAVKLDPAVMASPFITTIVDAVSLLIYFAIASTVLHL